MVRCSRRVHSRAALPRRFGCVTAGYVAWFVRLARTLCSGSVQFKPVTRVGEVGHEFVNCLPAHPVASKCDSCTSGQSCACSAPFGDSTSSCEDAPDALVVKGILLTYDRIMNFSAGHNKFLDIEKDNAIRSCADLKALNGGCSVPEADWLCPKTCAKCAAPRLSCLDCFTRPAFPLCYGDDAQLLPQCAKCRSGGCDSCASCTKPTELMPVLSEAPATDRTFMNGK